LSEQGEPQTKGHKESACAWRASTNPHCKSKRNKRFVCLQNPIGLDRTFPQIDGQSFGEWLQKARYVSPQKYFVNPERMDRRRVDLKPITVYVQSGRNHMRNSPPNPSRERTGEGGTLKEGSRVEVRCGRIGKGRKGKRRTGAREEGPLGRPNVNPGGGKG